MLFAHNFPLVHPGFESIDGDTTFNGAGLEAFRGIANEAAKLDIQNVGIAADLATKAGRLRIDARPAALPRARFYAGVKTFASRDELLGALDNGSLDYRKEVGVLCRDKLPTSSPGASGDSVKFRRESSRQYSLEYSVGSPGIIFVSQSYYPGWEVVGGKNAIIETFGAFQGIVIDRAGSGSLTVRFRPVMFRLGLLISGLTALALAAGCLRRAASQASTTTAG